MFANEYSGHAEKLLTIFLSKSVECIPIFLNQKELIMSSIDQFAAHIGIDWGDKKHDVCVQFNNGDRFNSAEEIQNYSGRGSFCTSGTDQVPEAGKCEEVVNA